MVILKIQSIIWSTRRTALFAVFLALPCCCALPLSFSTPPHPAFNNEEEHQQHHQRYQTSPQQQQRRKRRERQLEETAIFPGETCGEDGDRRLVVCRNGGTCRTGYVESLLSLSAVCDCSSAVSKDGVKYGGIFCEVPVRDQESFCDSHPNMFCMNGGTCKSNDQYLLTPEQPCSCLEGFVGPHCEYSKEHQVADKEVLCDLDCKNGGVCGHDEFFRGGMFCKCPPGYGGSRCEYQMEVCGWQEHFCWHGSRCALVDNGNDKALSSRSVGTSASYRCECPQAANEENDNNYCQQHYPDRTQHRPMQVCRTPVSSEAAEYDVGAAVPTFCVNGGQCQDVILEEGRDLWVFLFVYFPSLYETERSAFAPRADLSFIPWVLLSFWIQPSTWTHKLWMFGLFFSLFIWRHRNNVTYNTTSHSRCVCPPLFTGPHCEFIKTAEQLQGSAINNENVADLSTSSSLVWFVAPLVALPVLLLAFFGVRQILRTQRWGPPPDDLQLARTHNLQGFRHEDGGWGPSPGEKGSRRHKRRSRREHASQPFPNSNNVVDLLHDVAII